MSDLTKQIEEIILGAIPNAQVMVRDPMNDGAHFEATVISESFVGMSLVNQHRQVMQPLKNAFAGDLHALALKTYTPEKWASTQG
jgi:acid stress-induced BolA-like protein IbaG/YrbA